MAGGRANLRRPVGRQGWRERTGRALWALISLERVVEGETSNIQKGGEVFLISPQGWVWELLSEPLQVNDCVASGCD